MASQTISSVVTQLGDYIFMEWANLLLTSFNTRLLLPSCLNIYASAVCARHCPMDNIYGFMDMTFYCTSRPGKGQEANYSGYKKQHANKHNVIATPDSLIAHCSLPVEGQHADSAMLAESGLEPLMEIHARGVSTMTMTIACAKHCLQTLL